MYIVLQQLYNVPTAMLLVLLLLLLVHTYYYYYYLCMLYEPLYVLQRTEWLEENLICMK